MDQGILLYCIILYMDIRYILDIFLYDSSLLLPNVAYYLLPFCFCGHDSFGYGRRMV